MRPTAPENFDGNVTTDQLDPTWKVQVHLLDQTRRSTCMGYQITPIKWCIMLPLDPFCNFIMCQILFQLRLQPGSHWGNPRRSPVQTH